MENEQKLKKALTALSNSLENERKLRKNDQSLLLEEQKFRKELENKLIDYEIEIKKQNEEIETLQFNNVRLTKRVESLQNQINQGKTQKVSGFLDNFWSGKQKDIIEKLENQIEVISEELKVKIEENEHIHIQVFEMKKIHQKNLEEVNKKLNELKEIHSKQVHLIKLSEKIDEITISKSQWDYEKKEITTELINSKEIISTRICFQEDRNKDFSIYNPLPLSFDNIHKKSEWLCRGLAISGQLQSNFEECVRFVQSKLKIIQSDAQYNGINKELKLYVFVSECLAKSIAEYAQCLAEILKKGKIIAEMSQKINGKNIVRNIEEVREIRKKIGNDSEECLIKLGKLLELGGVVKEWTEKLLNEEMNLVENTVPLKEINEPIKNSINQLFKNLENFYSYFYSTKQLVPEKNLKFMLEKCFFFLNSFSSQLEKLLQSLKVKLIEENNCFNEDEDEIIGKLKWTFPIRSALSLKNYNNEILNSLGTTIFSLNSLFTIFIQYYQTEMKSEIANPDNLFLISLFNNFYNTVQKAPLGIKYSTALENKKNLSDFHKKNEEQTQQILSLKNALSEAEEQLDTIEETEDNKDFEQISNELMSLKIYTEKLKARYKELCLETGKDFEEKMDLSTNIDNDSYEENNENLNLSEDVEKGYQKLAIKFFNEKNKMTPINELISQEELNSDKTLILFEKAKSALKKLLIQNEFLNEKIKDLQRKSEGNKKEIEKAKGEKDKMEGEVKNLQKVINKNKEEVESLKQNYTQQISMLSEHIAQLTNK